MFRRIFVVAILGALAATHLPAQDANFGFSVPMTLSAGGMYTERLQSEGPASPFTGGFRAMFYPTLKLGPHWFAYAAVQVRLAPYFYYDAYDGDHEFYNDLIQAFLGYSFRAGQTSWVVKAGRLSSAFGSFPPRYDDTDNPLLDQPLQYVTELSLAANQLPCGVKDLTSQQYGSNWFHCGGATGQQNGLTPVTLYGLPGIEADVSGHGFDGRLQVTSGSPASPQAVGYANQYAQWTAGGGYTIFQGFRVGVSGFRGPYLDPTLATLLPAGSTVRDFPASAVGADVQWARGHWSVSGEWQKFWYDLPNFVQSPSVTAGYGEVRSVLTPRFYLAGRVGWMKTGRVSDNKGISADDFAPKMASYEFAAGCWLNRHQLLKIGYEWLDVQYQGGTHDNVLGVQLVTSIHALNWAFR
ncbi:MAG TPA: hypothetical protein VGP62_10935 [Bryobacteraceae bacterium]|jgi:hypothetical protein|nr:hypothetical protein [Bryobacteraceae bacterium]